MMKKQMAAIFLTSVLAVGLICPAVILQAEDHAEGNDAEKSETVYVKSDADGSVQEITVKDWLKISGAGEEIEDYSTLTGIKNTEGDEEFRQKEDGTLFWENHGENISYEGKSEKELPVSLQVSYYLDGEKKLPDEMAGVSGNVKIRFDFENRTSETVNVDGKNVEVPVPFTVVTAMMLPADIFSNVEVSSGKVIEDNDQSIVAGVAFPGLAESLKISEYEPAEDIELADYIEVTADVEKFELELTATVVSSGAMTDIDTDDINDLEKLTDGMEELTDASARLADGAGELTGGIETFQSYMDTYMQGVSGVNEGAAALAEGLAVLNTQKTNLEQGAVQLENGLESLNAVLSQISIPSGLEEVLTAVNVLKSDAQIISDNLDLIQNSLMTASAGLGEIDLAQIEADAAALAAEQAKSAVAAALENQEDLTEEQRQDILNSIDFSGINAAGASQKAQQEIDAVRQGLENEAADIGAGLSENLSIITGTLGDMQKQIEFVENYTGDIENLSGSASYLQMALDELTGGVEQLKTGSQQLVQGIDAYGDGVSKSSEGAQALSSGTAKLVDAGNQLNSGFSALLDGGSALENGLKTFNQEGIQKLSDLAGDDLKNVITRFKALKEADSRYNNFSGMKEGVSGDVKFIIETEEIK